MSHENTELPRTRFCGLTTQKLARIVSVSFKDILTCIQHYSQIYFSIYSPFCFLSDKIWFVGVFFSPQEVLFLSIFFPNRIHFMDM